MTDTSYIDFDLDGFEYDSQNFRELAESDLGVAAIAFMKHPTNVVRMQTATDLDRVAVEPLGKWLVKEFGDDASDDRFKQFVGHVARQIMEYIGYQHDRKSLQITRPNLFSSGSSYRMTPKSESPMRITKEQREAWLANTANDAFNTWLNAQVKPGGKLDLEKLYAVAREWRIDKRYDQLNPGQQRMNIGVALRKAVPEHIYKTTKPLADA
ncbi:hypothetical protein ELH24_09915 [Rhizobium ruizarguesonis]|uniref:hypothetical protein n=1 Tax=Rhizobium ruizarguesonis TaxID=2081791 RepID=UPI00102FDA41|nr:hypothetical protein [Rhizobium ruizarguesonis]TBC98962.1 hypothetical protein ELH25_09870 [Rhizobium ruizarguesonis]TBD15812.1 hypothetical protein ELH24_09915 [Rhizobium ruizarguesonis]TBD27729.1 hypothetical protein ELH20_09200 [Rhizobium ruizarguesonis]TBE32904.1 hypothetical protein ELH07_09720 [Rhizobium ruizarguesonis]TBE96827.1 hypothetical protein ELG98_09670 [Rhizobium ruizarguesonis]